MSQEYQNALPKDTILDTYRIEKVLGVGGFGVTYLAYELNLGKAYAIKELMPEGIAVRKAGETSVIARSTSDQDDFKATRERFISEARVLAAIEHPAVVAVHRLLEAHGTCYMVMDYVKGDTLDGYLKKQKGRIKDRAELDNLFLPILDGLEVLHGQELVHRDIKPGNIMVTPDNKPVLLDFGAVCAVQNKTITVTQMVSAGYSPFEQYTTKARQGPYTDIYAMGATMVRCITGKKPDDASDRVYGDSYTPLAENERYLAVYGKPMLSAIDAAVEMDPKNRPQTVSEWREMMIQSDSRPAIVLPEETAKPVDLPTPRPEPLEQADEFAPPVAPDSRLVAPPNEPSSRREKARGNKPLPKGGQAKAEKSRLLIALASAAVLVGVVIVLFWQPWSPKNAESVVNSKAEAAQKAQQQVVSAALALFKDGEPFPKNFFEKVNKDDLRSAADSGDARAQFLWGRANDESLGLLDNQSEAIKWYKGAALSGDTDGMRHLAITYRDGKGVSKDFSRAFEWFEKAAEQGDYEAMVELGDFYHPYMTDYKNVVRQSHSRAAKWYRKAAIGGSTAGMRKIGRLYLTGQGVPEDLKKFVEWCEKAGNRGDIIAMEHLASFYSPDATFPSEESSYSKWAEWIRKTAIAGSVRGMLIMGYAYSEGKGVPQDDKKAFEWREKAAAEGNLDAMIIMGMAYKSGKGVDQSYSKALELFEKVVNLEEKSGKKSFSGYKARELIGNFYDPDLPEYKSVVPQSYVKAVGWYRKAAILGGREGMRKLGYAYRDGKGVSRDNKKSFEWYHKAALAGDSFSMRSLGYAYRDSNIGVSQNYQKAFEWFEKAAKRGDHKAMVSLAFFYDPDFSKYKNVVGQSYVKAAEWHQKAAVGGNVIGMRNLGYAYRHGKGVSMDKQKSFEWYHKAALAGDSFSMRQVADDYRQGNGVSKDKDKAQEWLDKYKDTKPSSDWSFEDKSNT